MESVIIIGSGLGGLECGYILAKNGFQVTVLEHDSCIGGCLQTFRRGSAQFDTGFHYVGGLGEGQSLNALFRYFDLDEYGEKVYRREGHRYVVEPVALVFHEDNYYLMVYSAKHDSTANYRVDRMDHVEIVDEAISEKALTLREGIDSYTEQAFKMYGGQLVNVVLEFDDKLIGVVYDKFGEDTKMIRAGDKCIATVKVQISPVFWGWLFQFGGQMIVISPAEVAEKYRSQVNQLVDIDSSK